MNSSLRQLATFPGKKVMKMTQIQNPLNCLNNLNYLSLSENKFQYGPPGYILKKNLENLWFNQCIINPPYNVFVLDETKNFNFFESLTSKNVFSIPLGLAILENMKSEWNHWIMDMCKCDNLVHNTGKIISFVEPDTLKDNQLKIQRERKIWWKKLVCKPSRFNLAINNQSESCNVVDIIAEFQDEAIVVERIKCYDSIDGLIPEKMINKFDLFKTKAVEHTISFDWSTLVLILDGFNETNDINEFEIHPRLTPYKVSFSAPSFDSYTDSVKNDLNDLILFLNNLLKSKGIYTILSDNTMTNKNIYLNFHVPFIVNVEKSSLKTGIIKVYSHSTTLCESVHVTDLVQYISLRCL